MWMHRRLLRVVIMINTTTEDIFFPFFLWWSNFFPHLNAAVCTNPAVNMQEHRGDKHSGACGQSNLSRPPNSLLCGPVWLQSLKAPISSPTPHHTPTAHQQRCVVNNWRVLPPLPPSPCFFPSLCLCVVARRVLQTVKTRPSLCSITSTRHLLLAGCWRLSAGRQTDGRGRQEQQLLVRWNRSVTVRQHRLFGGFYLTGCICSSFFLFLMFRYNFIRGRHSEWVCWAFVSFKGCFYCRRPDGDPFLKLWECSSHVCDFAFSLHPVFYTQMNFIHSQICNQ